jgi:hypothetical protein
LNEIENKDITITPISKVNLKKRKVSDSIIITGNTQIVPPSPPTQSYTRSVVSVPITITKDDNQQVDELINIKLEPFEELLSSNTQLRSSADITVQEIFDWAKTFKIPQSAVNELLQILKIKRVKTEVKSETTIKSADGTSSAPSQQRMLFIHFFCHKNLFDHKLIQLFYHTFHRNNRTILKNLPTNRDAGAKLVQSNQLIGTQSRYEKFAATKNPKRVCTIESACQMRYTAIGHIATATTTTTKATANL